MLLKRYLKIFLNLKFLFLLIFNTSCKTVGYDEVTTKDFIPEKGSVESDLWFLAEKVEETLKNNHPLVIKDKSVNDYVKGVFCKIEPEYCDKIRIYLVRNPLFNAGMYPNGLMMINSGALLVMENEAQLASLLGHEFGHYYYRHSIKNYQKGEVLSNLVAVFNVAAMLGSAYITMNPYSYYNFDIINAMEIGRLGIMLAQLSYFKYSRDNETQADIYGLKALKKYGYHLDEAPKIWEKIIKIDNKANRRKSFKFTNTHPTPSTRIDNLKNKISSYDSNKTGYIGTTKYSIATSKNRTKWVKDEIFMGEFEKAKYVIKNISLNKQLPAEKNYFLGEYYKTKFVIEKNKTKKQKYFENALRHFKIATELDDKYPLPFLSIGSLLIKENEKEAKQYFQKFVELVPKEPYAKLIKMEYLQ